LSKISQPPKFDFMDDIRIIIDNDTAAWLNAQAANEVDGAVGKVIERLVAERRVLEDDVARNDHLWAKAAVDAGLASLDRGEGSTLDDVIERARGSWSCNLCARQL
jgi:predicted transcriptional regulator